ncbi:MAG: molybdopterin adenylyltransferase [Deltaproteobacteria bacterium]|jgi:molybdopterin adenylyltransferase|nr:molybdopterin adenylyltransferase [Deltaproteobacteria bacterium]MBT4527315.1 molybdopterin adenylyltransferase [Deltaproteobacteria bacterium]
MKTKSVKIGIITVSDRASKGEYEDKGGPAIIDWLNNTLTTKWEPSYSIIPDEQQEIEKMLCQKTDDEACCLILTTGGTGPAKRDVTPEATLAIADKVMNGFGEQMRAISLKYVPTAILSRQVGVIRNNCLIINLPGQPKAIKETLDDLFAAIPYCIELMDGPIIQTNPEIVVAFRPKSAKPIPE